MSIISRAAALVMLLTTTTLMILMLAVVNCQFQTPLDSETAVNEHSHHSRRLHAAYHSNSEAGDDDDDDDDARWLLMGAAAAAAGLTSLISVFALCTCCPPYRTRRRNDESYIGQIDLEDIRVICNRAVTSPDWSASDGDSGVVVNAGALDKQHAAVLNNQRATQQRADYKTAAAAAAGGDNNACSDAAGMSDVVVENGRIVLQYRNVHAAKTDEPDTADCRTRAGHVISAPVKPPTTDLDSYDMNDVVWKNMAASCTE